MQAQACSETLFLLFFLPALPKLWELVEIRLTWPGVAVSLKFGKKFSGY